MIKQKKIKMTFGLIKKIVMIKMTTIRKCFTTVKMKEAKTQMLIKIMIKNINNQDNIIIKKIIKKVRTIKVITKILKIKIMIS